MISVPTARALRTSGVRWDPASGDRFVIADRDMDDEVFVLSELVVEAHDHATGRFLGFNGTTEWALDSVDVEQAVWLPREGQLRGLLGDTFVALERRGGELVVRTRDAAGEHTSTGDDAEETYALAVLGARARAARAG